MVQKHLRERFESIDNDCKYSIAGRPGYSHVSLTACSALTDSAVVLFCQIFSSGYEGNGTARNRGNAEVDGFRDEMEQYARTKLRWSRENYLRFLAYIEGVRNSFVAHYDGDKADYQEPAPGITSMKSVGSNLMPKDTQKLTKLVGVMYEFINIKLVSPSKEVS